MHGNRDIELVTRCGVDSLHSVEHIQTPDSPPLPTLRLNLRLSAELVASALAQAGKKVELWHRSGPTATIKARASPADSAEMDELLSQCTSTGAQDR